MDDLDFLDELDDEEDLEFNDLPLDDEFIRDHFSNVPESVIENFPFVEDDVDAITDYELFSKGFGYLDEKKANKEDIPDTKDFIKKDEVAEVALTGDYDDLLNKPELFSGDYNDLTNKPTIPTKTSELDNDSGYITKDVNDLVNYTLTTSLATVATTGSYSDLSNKPTIPDVSNFITKDVNDLTYYTLSSSLSSVATSGSYTDLSNTPTIPTVNNATLTIQKNGTTVDTFTANASSDKTINITVPTQTSQLTNNSGFVKNTDYANGTTAGVIKVNNYSTAITNDGKLYCTTSTYNNYQSYNNGNFISKGTLENVITGKGLVASSSLSSVATSGSYNDLSNKPTIPTKTSELNNDSGYLSMTSLYHYASGIDIGTANLSDNVTNYKKIDIVYHSNDSVDDVAVRTLDNPYNGMKSYLDYKFILGNTIYEKIMTITVGTNTINIVENAEFQIGSSTINSGSKIYITDVIGYK